MRLKSRIWQFRFALVLFYISACETTEDNSRVAPPAPPVRRASLQRVEKFAKDQPKDAGEQLQKVARKESVRQEPIPEKFVTAPQPQSFSPLVILPFASQGNAAFIRTGMIKALRQINPPLLKRTRLVESKDFTKLISAPEKLKFSMLLGGYLSSEIDPLRAIARQSLMPTAILSPGLRTDVDQALFFAYPGHRDLGRKILEELQSRGHKKISIGFSQGNEEEPVAQYIKKNAEKYGIEVIYFESYFGTDYGRIDQFVRKVLELDPAKRQEEVRALQENAPPNSKQELLLPPKPQHDALVVLDEARIVRHIAKILAFYGARDFVLAGASGWRNSDIIQSADPLMSRSFFVDFLPVPAAFAKVVDVKNTADIPEGVFLPEESTELEFKWIGYHLGQFLHRLSVQSLKDRQSILRYLNARSSRFTDDEGYFLWPVQTFNIRYDQVIPAVR